MANLPRNMIELVTGVEGDEVETQKYWTPPFLSLAIKYEAIDLMEEYEDWPVLEKEDRKELIDKVIAFVAETLYDKQFTREELEKGLYGPTAFDNLFEQVAFASAGFQSEETKKFLEKKN